jgi:aspartate racemase
MSRPGRHSYGIVGGLSALAGADVMAKLVKASPSGSGRGQDDLLFEQHPFNEAAVAGAADAAQTARKLYVFELIRDFQRRQVDAVLLPCFISHTFLDELAAEVDVPIVDLMAALRAHVADRHPGARRLGVLTSDYVMRAGLFERAFQGTGRTLLYPRPGVQAEQVMGAIYGPDGIKTGHLGGGAAARLAEACRDLADQGADLVLPGFTEIPVVLDALRDVGVPVVDCNQVYAQAAVDLVCRAAPRTWKVGVVGGVGPAATVDFLAKIVASTPASRDQDHIKVIVEQNPQIPDRTRNLVAGGPDPTLALFHACKQLEAAGADLVAIPCNTAHAFVERIQPHLGIPIVNMIQETVEHLRRHPARPGTVGLLATDGTVASRVYQDAAGPAGVRLVVPDPEHQRRVMAAIYGPRGVKAGFREGECQDDLRAAMEHLVRDRGAEALILGCTELPLLVAGDDRRPVLDRVLPVLDPTGILARRCVDLVLGGNREAAAGDPRP